MLETFSLPFLKGGCSFLFFFFVLNDDEYDDWDIRVPSMGYETMLGYLFLRLLRVVGERDISFILFFFAPAMG